METVKTLWSNITTRFSNISCSKCRELCSITEAKIIECPVQIIENDCFHFFSKFFFPLMACLVVTSVLGIGVLLFLNNKSKKSEGSTYKFKTNQLIRITAPKIKQTSLKILAQTCKEIAPEFTKNRSVEVDIRDGNVLDIVCKFKPDQDLTGLDKKIQNIINMIQIFENKNPSSKSALSLPLIYVKKIVGQGEEVTKETLSVSKKTPATVGRADDDDNGVDKEGEEAKSTDSSLEEFQMLNHEKRS